MANIKEFITSATAASLNYKITCNAVKFRFKGHNDAKVGLARIPGLRFEYCIVIENDRCNLLINNHHRDSVSLPDYMSNQQDVYKEYWISWYENELHFGCKDISILSRTIDTRGLQYVTFAADNHGSMLHWKVFLPPKLERRLLKMVPQGSLYWKKLDNLEPPIDALIGGYSNSIQYIIKAPWDNSILPGRFSTSEREGRITVGGAPIAVDENLEILCGFNGIWVPTSGNKIPVGAVVGGYCEYIDENLYIGRAAYNNNVLPGKVSQCRCYCLTCIDLCEISNDVYEVLVDVQNSGFDKDIFKKLSETKFNSQHEASNEDDDEERNSDFSDDII